MQQHELVGRLNVVMPEINVISGGISRGETGEDAFSSGQVYYIDRVLLRPFNTARAAMQRICRQRGVRFLSGYAIPDASLPAVLDELQRKREEIEVQIENFLSIMPEKMEEWRSAHPEIAPWEGEFPTVEQARKRLSVSVGVFKITPDNEAGGDVLQEVAGLAGRALEEIAMDIRLSWEPKAPEVTQKARGIFRRAVTKLRSLLVIDPHLGEVADSIEQVLGTIPTEGKIAGKDFLVLTGLVNSLSSPRAMLSMCEQLKAVAPQDLWGTQQASEADEMPTEVDEESAKPEDVPEPAEALAEAPQTEAWAW